MMFTWLHPRKNEVEELQTDPQNFGPPTWLGHFGWVQVVIFILCSEYSFNLTGCYITLMVHNINGQSTVPQLHSILPAYNSNRINTCAEVSTYLMYNMILIWKHTIIAPFFYVVAKLFKEFNRGYFYFCPMAYFFTL